MFLDLYVNNNNTTLIIAEQQLDRVSSISPLLVHINVCVGMHRDRRRDAAVHRGPHSERLPIAPLDAFIGGMRVGRQVDKVWLSFGFLWVEVRDCEDDGTVAVRGRASGDFGGAEERHELAGRLVWLAESVVRLRLEGFGVKKIWGRPTHLPGFDATSLVRRKTYFTGKRDVHRTLGVTVIVHVALLFRRDARGAVKYDNIWRIDTRQRAELYVFCDVSCSVIYMRIMPDCSTLHVIVSGAKSGVGRRGQ